MSTHSVFGGTLSRIGLDQWHWSDNTPEPRVTDLSPSQHYNFRCRTYGDTTYVEILAKARSLGWQG